MDKGKPDEMMETRTHMTSWTQLSVEQIAQHLGMEVNQVAQMTADEIEAAKLELYERHQAI